MESGQDHWTEREVSSLESIPDGVLRSVARAPRRYVLRYLSTVEEASLSRLGVVVAGLCTADDGRLLASPELYERTQILLHHVHLPALAHQGLLEYDPTTHRARSVQLPEALFDLFDQVVAAEAWVGCPQTDPLDVRPPAPPAPRTPIRSLETLVDEVERTAMTLELYAHDPPENVIGQFLSRNVRTDYHPLPSALSPGFVVLRTADRLVGICHLDVLTSVDNPYIGPPWKRTPERTAYRKFLNLFRDAAFATMDRTRLLATSREIEDRAFRTARGELRAGFQSLSALQAQVPVYRELSEVPGLSIHVYGRPEWVPTEAGQTTVHPIVSEEIGRFWFVAFLDPHGENSCALVAQERDRDEYYGFWTYEHETVREITAYLERTYGDE